MSGSFRTASLAYEMNPSPRSRMERRGIHRVSEEEVRLRGVVRKN